MWLSKWASNPAPSSTSKGNEMSNIVVNSYLVGDRVKCVDATGQTETGLVCGRHYVIRLFEPAACSDYDLLKVFGLPEWYSAYRFEPESILWIATESVASEPADPLIEQRRELKRMLGGI